MLPLINDRLGQEIKTGDYIVYASDKWVKLFVGKVIKAYFETDQFGVPIRDGVTGKFSPVVVVRRAHDFLNPPTINDRESKLSNLNKIVVVQPSKPLIDLYAREGL